MKPKNYYKENELEFLMLFRQFKQKIEDGSIMNDEKCGAIHRCITIYGELIE
jgi:hypothetical protein